MIVQNGANLVHLTECTYQKLLIKLYSTADQSNSIKKSLSLAKSDNFRNFDQVFNKNKTILKNRLNSCQFTGCYFSTGTTVQKLE